MIFTHIIINGLPLDTGHVFILEKFAQSAAQISCLNEKLLYSMFTDISLPTAVMIFCNVAYFFSHL